MCKPNILMIMTDQQTYRSISYGKESIPKTPILDELAKESFVFTNAYTPSPVCAPARAAIKTGVYPPTCGVVTNWVELNKDVDLMTERLVNQGYDTALVGKLHFMPHKNPFGFQFKKLNDAPYSIYADDDKYSKYIDWLRDNYFNKKGIDPVELFDEDESSYTSNTYKFAMGSDFRQEEEHDVPWTVNESIEYLKQRDTDNPFFLFTSFFGPHHPYIPPKPWADMYDIEDIKLPNNWSDDMKNNPIFQKLCGENAESFKKQWQQEDYKNILKAYYGQISMIDYYIGELLSYLKDNNLWDNTMIVFVADHGDYAAEYGLFFKGQMYDACCKIPMFIKMPKNQEDCKRQRNGFIDSNVNSLDLYGTILDIAGDQGWQNEKIESRSLMPLMNIEDKNDWNNQTYSIIGQDKDYSLAMLRKDHLKIMRLAQGEQAPLYELYDMNVDKDETNNLTNNSNYREIFGQLKLMIDDWHTKQMSKYPETITSLKK